MACWAMLFSLNSGNFLKYRSIAGVAMPPGATEFISLVNNAS